MRLKHFSFVVGIMLSIVASVGTSFAQAPAWWTARGVTNGQPADDYAVANIGQLKHIATKAAEEIQARYSASGGAGSAINNLIVQWQNPSASVDDYAAVNQGQLKYVAAIFYDRLNALGYTGAPLRAGETYPWSVDTGDDDNFALANLGQLKFVFSFNPSVVDSTRPSTPSGLYVVGPVTPTVFTLAWSPSDDYGGSGVVRYEISRDTINIGPSYGLSAAINNGIAASTTYAMRVQAIDAAGNASDWSAPLSVTTPEGTPPDVPTGLAIVGAVSYYDFTLSWNASSDHGGSGVVRYDISRDDVGIGPSYTTSSPINNGIQPNRSYAMRVRAVDAAGNASAWSTAYYVTTLGLPQNISISLSWPSTTIVSGQSITFTASGAQNGYSWAWGGSPSGNGSVRGFMFTTPFSYVLTVYSPSGGSYAQSNTATMTITVIPSTPGDGDNDSIPDNIETVLGANLSNTGVIDSTNGTVQLKIHKP